MKNLTGYWAEEDRIEDLKKEISRSSAHKIIKNMGPFFILEGPECPFVFAQNTWKNLKRAEFASISEASRLLKESGVLWLNHSEQKGRRSALIQEQLAKVKDIKCQFLQKWPPRKLGGWLLEDEKTLWYASELSVPFLNGEIPFEENQTPPSRAYMKLWEIFTREQFTPKPQSRCLEIGACPGGWTWVLDQLKCSVLAIDRSPLDPKTKFSSRIQFLKGDAFQPDLPALLQKSGFKELDWIFSDLICYPEKLLEWVKKMINEGFTGNFVCTIKFQGETDFKTMDAFSQFTGSKILHLSANKHEVTWFWLRNKT